MKRQMWRRSLSAARRYAHYRLPVAGIALLLVAVSCTAGSPKSRLPHQVQPAGSAEASAPAITTTGPYSPPGGSAPWADRADGCQGVSLPPGSPAPMASDVGVTTSELLLGTTQPLTGGQDFSNTAVIDTIKACFDAVNATGGIYGRAVRWLMEDDASSGVDTQFATRKLVDRLHVFAIASPLGLPASMESYDYLNAGGVPQFFMMTGGAMQIFRDPERYPWSGGFQPDFEMTARIIGRYVQRQLVGKTVGILYQDDGYGHDALGGMQAVLGEIGKPGSPIVAAEPYALGTRDVLAQMARLRNAGSQVLIFLANGFYTAQALKWAGSQDWRPAVIVNDVSLSPALFSDAGGPQNIEGVVTPFYLQVDRTDPAVQEVDAFLARSAPELRSPDQPYAVLPIAGYVVAQLWIELLKRAGVNPTRLSLKDALESFNDFAIPQLQPGVTVTMSPTNHRPIHCARFGQVRNGARPALQLLDETVCADR